ncbi:hypothetical protein LC048_10515 [Mesobacillus subterraneus]|uniref:hypothetical protein n=1 Tax=Mesobacillus subterraneus TaxID=285983 RepID=UPI001CFC8BC6|nr:hypothetical protein [Mesobacillus subterraneus]WLR57248.1 hypothetical protein LC048_10515 [Mesobacillus subterraneus]
MKKLVILLVVFVLTACGPRLDENAQLAKEYLKDQGYSIKSYEGKYSHIIKREQLIHKPDMSVWAVQTEKPDAYIGKEIIQERFIVKNHPLSKIYGPQKSFSYKVSVSVFMFKGEIIGGISFPVGNGIAGSPYSLDGKTSEEVIKMDHVEWQNQWIEKYGD